MAMVVDLDDWDDDEDTIPDNQQAASPPRLDLVSATKVFVGQILSAAMSQRPTPCLDPDTGENCMALSIGSGSGQTITRVWFQGKVVSVERQGSNMVEMSD
eukprot:Sspe_Gene.53917::Locus_29783_Transcript_4_4_Confidence_0.583_Length_358::g.53917::m.53917